MATVRYNRIATFKLSGLNGNLYMAVQLHGSLLFEQL